MTDEVWEFLRQPGNLEAALEVEKALTDVKKRLFQTFWDHIFEELNRRLKDSGHDQRWKVFGLDDDIFENWACLGIDQHPPLDGRFCVYIENPTINPTYGIVRGSGMGGVKFKELDPQDLKDKLYEKGVTRYSTGSAWVSYCRLRDHSSLPSAFHIHNDSAVIALAREEEDQNKPLMQQIINLIWDFFCDFREDLERFNENYPFPAPDA